MLRMTLGRVHAWAVPLGAVRVGDIRSRSLLFKVLGDQPEIGVPSDLGRLFLRRIICTGPHSRCHVWRCPTRCVHSPWQRYVAHGKARTALCVEFGALSALATLWRSLV